MRRKLLNGRSMNCLAVLLVLSMVLCQSNVHAMENITVPTESNEIVSIVLPVVEERDPFSFFIDPLHIFYNTFGSSGGDITVEEDTCLLFCNRDDGGYTLSSRSDSLNIINESTVPVKVTITAKLEDTGGISLVQDRVFEDRACDLYLALVDSEGNEQPLSEGGEASVTVTLDRAPLDAYAYVFCKETGKYEYDRQCEEAAFDTYSFGLTGACNGDGEWGSISGSPHVTISWNVEPVISEGSKTGEELRDVSGNSISGNDVRDKEWDKEGEGSGGTEAEEESGDKPDEKSEDRPDEKSEDRLDEKPEDKPDDRPGSILGNTVSAGDVYHKDE